LLNQPKKATLSIKEAKVVLGVGRDKMYGFAQDQYLKTVMPEQSPVVPVIRVGTDYLFAKKPFYKALNTGRIQL